MLKIFIIFYHYDLFTDTNFLEILNKSFYLCVVYCTILKNVFYIIKFPIYKNYSFKNNEL